MGKNLVLKRFWCPEDIAEYFYRYFDPALLNNSFPTRREAEELLRFMERNSFVLHYDINSGVLFRESVNSSECDADDVESLEEYSFEKAVQLCMTLADSVDVKDNSVMGCEKGLELFTAWHCRMDNARRSGCVLAI